MDDWGDVVKYWVIGVFYLVCMAGVWACASGFDMEWETGGKVKIEETEDGSEEEEEEEDR